MHKVFKNKAKGCRTPLKSLQLTLFIDFSDELLPLIILINELCSDVPFPFSLTLFISNFGNKILILTNLNSVYHSFFTQCVI